MQLAQAALVFFLGSSLPYVLTRPASIRKHVVMPPYIPRTDGA